MVTFDFLTFLQMQQKNGGQAVNCSYPSDQRGLQGVYPNSSDCGHSGSAKAENHNMQPKVNITSALRAFAVLSCQCTSSESPHIHVTVFLFSINLCSVSDYIIVFCYEVHCHSCHISAL